MGLYYLFLLAVVQAVTEFLPVSSSGHLIIVSEISGVDSSLAVDVLLHAGTLLALIFYYRKKLISLAKKGGQKLLKNILISSIPAVLAGLVLGNWLASDSVRSTNIVIFMLIAVGIIMVLEKRLFASSNNKSIESLTPKKAFGVGLAQMTALIPGTSRSGASIIGGRLAGLNNSAATDYAFLIGIPIIFGASAKILLENESRDFIASYPFDAMFGILVTAAFGWLAIVTVLKLVKKFGLKWFGIYRIVLALILLMII